MTDLQVDYPTVGDWEKAMMEIQKRLQRKPEKGVAGVRDPQFRYSFDLDGTLCDTEGRDYTNATPRPEMIALVNALVRAGHHVEIVTGRGYLDGVPNDKIREAADQLASWGCRYTKLGSRGPSDIVFDDKGMRVTRQRYSGYDWS